MATDPADGGVAAAPSRAPSSDLSGASDAELRERLRQALDLLARHEAELEALRRPSEPAPAPAAPPAPEPPTPSHWYERLNIRGYTQVRVNLPGAVYNDKAINEQADKSMGGGGGFLIRRARVILFGDVHPRVSVYFQPDFASAIDDQLGVSILRDWYADVFLDAQKEFRFRVGQSKVPYGFENMQSSQNRLPLDRNDALNSAVKDERDLGVFFYWAPAHIRARFKHLVDSGLKGSGDYGVVAVGAYNGQTANRLDLNKFPHVIGRVTWPFAVGSQFFELGGGGYWGQATVKVGKHPDGTDIVSMRTSNTFRDARAFITAVWYPKPFGFQFEYTVGVGPQLGLGDQRYVLDDRLLYGGYAQLMYKVDDVLGAVALTPYVRGTMYDGGKKFVTNSPYYQVREVEAGVELQVNRSLELVLAYLVTDRTNDKTYRSEYGHWTRLQVQVSY
ncbi:MAG: porin [Myxococcaceae bacterium]|nr:porin [Myxococcaceae bacterium]